MIALYLLFDFNIDYIFLLALIILLVIVALKDLYFKIIPDKLVLLGGIIGLLYKLSGIMLPIDTVGYIEGFLGFAAGGGLFLIIAAFSRGSIGGGDIKLMAMLGLWFGWRGILFISLMAYLMGGAISIILLVLRFKGRRDFIPFGPFIVISACMYISYCRIA